MGVFDQFPYTNFHDLNLDWIVKKVSDVEQKADNIAEDVTRAETAADSAEASAASATVAAERANGYLNNFQNLANELEGQVESMSAELRNQVETNATNIGLNTDAIAANSARIDGFTALAEGSTTGDAELADARVGYNGVTYANAGTAIRSQIADAELPINSFNLFNSANIQDALIGANGTPTATANWKGVFYVPTHGATHIALVGYFTRLTVGAQNNIVCYNANKTMLGGCFQAVNNQYYQQTVALLPNTEYVSICTATSLYGKGQMYLYPMIDYFNNFDTDLVNALAEINKTAIITYDFRGNYWKSDINGGFDPTPKNRLIYVEPLTNNSSLTGLVVYGMYGENISDGYDTLMSVSFKSVGRIVTERSYHHIQIASVPFTSPAEFTFKYGEIDYVNSLISLYNQPVNNLPAIFRKVVCCGDSYTCATIFESDGTIRATNESYAWPFYIGNTLGSNWVNCGASGTNVLTWQTHVRGLLKAQQSGKAQAYMVGLGINDGRAGDTHVDVGTPADIGTDAQTYYGGLSQIVLALSAISPKAHIFIQTNPGLPFPATDYSAYNTAVRDVVSYYQLNGKRVHLLDLAELKELYLTPAAQTDLFHQHPTAAGYEMMAETTLKIMSNYMQTHINNFKDVFTIPYDN